jgi:Brp/Blh family beta-carotene 15,15'-monooxygenase
MPRVQTSFRIAPLGCLLAAAITSLLLGPAWSMRTAGVPWLIALVAVGLPHGAADLAVSRRLCGWQATLWLFSVYLALMVAVAAMLVLAPSPTVLLFAALSIWHFGLSHAHGQSPPPPAGWPWQAIAAAARGASVLGVPLAVWPVETSSVIADVLSLVSRVGTGPPPAFEPGAIRIAGICLTLTGMIALAIEAWCSRHVPGALRRSADTLVDLMVIGLLGATADPLFSIGLYFLCWHAWREMLPLMAVIRRPAAEGHRPRAGLPAFVRDLVAVHVAAVPLLIPTWIALAAAWWLLSPSRSSRDLAVLSLAVYLVVTPAHEALHDVLRADWLPRLRRLPPAVARQKPSPTFRRPAHSCTARSASS